MHWIRPVIALVLLAAEGFTKRELNDYDDDDFIPFLGPRNDHFDWKLCSALDEREPGNVVASPVSVKMVLSLLHEASTGETARELERALQLGTSRSITRVVNSALIKTLKAPNPNYDLELGFRLFIDKRLRLKNWYKNILDQFYGANFRSVDFKKPGPTAAEMNQWTNYITRGHIKQLVSDAETMKDAVLVVINAIFFKGQWKNPFPLEDSYNGTFKSAEGLKPARFMTQTALFYYSESDALDAQLLRLPYKGKKFAMYILLPKKVDGLNQLLTNISPFALRRALWGLEETSVSVTLPIFQFEFMTELKKVLIEMGIESIFTKVQDLPGIVSAKNKEEMNAVVSSIMQKASIQITESGTIAAAATETMLVNKMGIPELVFNASHPFLFFIQDETTGTIIFEGKFTTPSETSTKLDIPGSRLSKDQPQQSTDVPRSGNKQKSRPKTGVVKLKKMKTKRKGIKGKGKRKLQSVDIPPTSAVV